MTSPLHPLRLPDLPEQRTRLTDLHLEFAGEAVSACGQTLTVREVGEDWQVRCTCGWWGIPLVSLPEVVRCEACDTLAEGRRRAQMFDREGIEARLRIGNWVFHAVHGDTRREG